MKRHAMSSRGGDSSRHQGLLQSRSVGMASSSDGELPREDGMHQDYADGPVQVLSRNCSVNQRLFMNGVQAHRTGYCACTETHASYVTQEAKQTLQPKTFF